MTKTDKPVWLITGAAGALGRELVRRAMNGGRDCIALDRDKRALNALHDELEAASLPVPALMPMDLAGASPDDYARLAGRVQETFGRLDMLVHNAAAFHALRPLLQQPPEEWMEIVQCGLTAPFLLTRELLPLLAQGESPGVIFISDAQCLDNPGNWAAYGVVQAARRHMVRTLAEELGPRGPRILEIDPGPFYSRLRTAAWPADSPRNLPSAAEAATQVMERIDTPGAGRHQET